MADSSLRGSEQVLLVEDEEHLLAATREFLESAGYSVIAANNGIEALSAVEKHPGAIDLLLTDVIMPELDGVELARTVRARHPRLRILYMSGYADRPIEGLGKDAMLLRKPFSHQLLASKIREALSRPEPA